LTFTMNNIINKIFTRFYIWYMSNLIIYKKKRFSFIKKKIYLIIYSIKCNNWFWPLNDDEVRSWLLAITGKRKDGIKWSGLFINWPVVIIAEDVIIRRINIEIDILNKSKITNVYFIQLIFQNPIFFVKWI